MKPDQVHHFDHFQSIAAGNVKYRRRFRYFWDSITDYCDSFIKSEDSIIEIGCGTGEMLNDLKGSRKLGVDFSPNMIAIAKGNFPNIEFVTKDAHQLGIDEQFDVVILSNLIGYLDDIQKVLQEVEKLCHSRTRIHITYYNQGWEFLLNVVEQLGLKRKTPRQNWISRSDLNNMLSISGIDVITSTRKMLIPFNIPLISYFFNRFLAPIPLINSLCLNTYTFARMEPVNSTTPYSVSIIVPVKNESRSIDHIAASIPTFQEDCEVIFVEGNSTDNTWEKLKALNAGFEGKYSMQIAQQEGKGKWDAVKKGFSLASGDILMILDADLTVQSKNLPKFYDLIASGKGEFINGCRLVYPMEDEAMRFLNKRGNVFFSKCFSWLIDRRIKDTLCGTKVLFRKDFERIKEVGIYDPFGDFTLLSIAHELNLKVIDLPIRYKSRKLGETQISRFKNGWQLWKFLLKATLKYKMFGR